MAPPLSGALKGRKRAWLEVRRQGPPHRPRLQTAPRGANLQARPGCPVPVPTLKAHSARNTWEQTRSGARPASGCLLPRGPLPEAQSSLPVGRPGLCHQADLATWYLVWDRKDLSLSFPGRKVGFAILVPDLPGVSSRVAGREDPDVHRPLHIQPRRGLGVCEPQFVHL